MEKSLSQVLIDSAKDLGFDQVTIDRLEVLSVPEVKKFTPKQIKALRSREKVSQGVFALFFNVSSSTVQKWERGDVKPQSAALRLINLVHRKGLAVLL